MKKLIYTAGLLLTANLVYGALITRTYTYSSGNTISANENNTNENTLFSEINGNLNNANILDGGIARADLASGIIDATKLDSTLVSSFTFVNTLAGYRRPKLVYIGATTADVENNSATSNETCVLFRNSQRRCVTENTSSTSKYRRFTMTETAEYTSGTEESGLRSGTVEANNTVYCIYAVQSLIDNTKFVLVGSTITPASPSSLNTNLGTDTWVYLGRIFNGDHASVPGDIKAFVANGEYTDLSVTDTAGAVITPATGIHQSSTTAATLAFEPQTGVTTISLLDGVSTCVYQIAMQGGSNIGFYAKDFGASRTYVYQHTNSDMLMLQIQASATRGLQLLNTGGASKIYEIFLTGYYDSYLSGAF